MKQSIYVEPVSSSSYRASVGLPWEISVEAPTRSLAIEAVKAAIAQKAAHGELVEVDLPSLEANPWDSICGSWRDHPDINQFEANVREYRAQVDALPEWQ